VLARQRPGFIPPDIPPGIRIWLYDWVYGLNVTGSKTVDGRKVVRGFESLSLRLRSEK